MATPPPAPPPTPPAPTCFDCPPLPGGEPEGCRTLAPTGHLVQLPEPMGHSHRITILRRRALAPAHPITRRPELCGSEEVKRANPLLHDDCNQKTFHHYVSFTVYTAKLIHSILARKTQFK